MSTHKESTQKTLARIEETLVALCDEVTAIRGKVEALEGSRDGQMTTQEIIDFLDGYRAAEAMAATALSSWVAVSDTPCLRGGLRAVALREASHAKLFEERIKELGGSPKAEADEGTEAFLMGFSDERSDAEKVAAFMKAAGDPKVLDALEAQAARMDHDEETQYLLRCVIEDERASLGLVKQAHELLCGS